MRALKLIAFLCLAVVIGWQFFLRYHRLGFVPEEMKISRIIYAKEEAWGFGPGGNEAGFIIFELPIETADHIIKNGTDYLSSFPSAQLGYPQNQQWQYKKWYATPVDLRHKVPFAARRNDPECGFCIDIEPDIVSMFDKTISTSGNFYAYGRTGMIVIAPSIQKVFYLYAG